MAYKHCPACNYEWLSREALLGDPDIELIGYQSNFRTLSAGIMLFNHSCKGTLGLSVEDFEDLYKGPIFEERYDGGPDCPNHCMHQGNLKPCPAQCECAYVREIIQILKTWPKFDKKAKCNTG